MKQITIAILVLITSTLSAQIEYFNVINDNEWTNSLSTNVETDGEFYFQFGMHSEQGLVKNHVHKWNLNGELIETIYESSLGLFSHYCESFNKIEDGFIIGSSFDGAYAIKLDLDGNELWQIEVQDSLALDTEFHFSTRISENSYLFVGRKYYNTDDDIWPNYSTIFLVKTTSEGGIVWEREFSAVPDLFARAIQCFELPNGELVLTAGVAEPWDPVILRLDSEGNHYHTHQWGEADVHEWAPWAVLEDDGQTLTLITFKHHGVHQQTGFDIRSIVLYRYDLETDSMIEEVDFEDTYQPLEIFDFIKAHDGGYVAVGSRNEGGLKGFLHKYSADLELEWMKTYSHEFRELNYLYDIELAPDGGYIMAGHSKGYDMETQTRQAWLLKVDACGDEEWMGCTTSIEEVHHSEFSVYPNPSQEKLTLELSNFNLGETYSVSLRNTLGQEVLTQPIFSYETELEVSSLPKGVYLLALLNDEREIHSEQVVIY